MAVPQPLDLGDIRKTQRRVAALLNFSAPNSGLGLSNRRHNIPAGYCYACSRLDPDGKYMGNPHRHLFRKSYFKRCEHSPSAPYPTLVEARPNSVSSAHDGKLFDTAVLNPDTLEHDPLKFKLPPVFVRRQESDRGRLVPHISEKTFLSTDTHRLGRSRNENRLSLPHLSNEKQSLITHRGKDDILTSRGGKKNRRASYTGAENAGFPPNLKENKHKGKGRRRSSELNVLKQDPNNIGPWTDDSTMDSAILKYHHRQNGKSGSGVNVLPVGKTRQQNSKELSFEFHRRGTYSVSPSGSISLSGESPLSPDMSFLISRIRSATWCECPDLEGRQTRCNECFQTGNHEKWCVSKTAVCAKCGKPVKKKQHHLEKRTSNLSFSKSSTKETLNLNSSEHRKSDKTSKKQDSNVHVTFSETENVREISTEMADDKSESREQKDLSNQKDLLAESFPNTAQPTFDPNIHKRAYVLALADSRVKKLRKNPDIMENSVAGVCFSYFPLYKHRDYRLPQNSLLGLRDASQGKKLKIKKGMKHILGALKVSDYYPGGKSFPKPITRKDGGSRKV